MRVTYLYTAKHMYYVSRSRLPFSDRYHSHIDLSGDFLIVKI